MCNRDVIGGLILLAALSLFSASFTMGLAMLLAYQLGSVLKFAQLTGHVVATMVAMGVATASLTGAAALIGSNCITGPCASPWANVRIVLQIASSILAGLVLSLFVSLIPGGAVYAGPVVVVGLLGAAATLGGMTALLFQVESCVAGTGASSSIVFSAAVIVLPGTAVVATAFAVLGMYLGIFQGFLLI